MTTLIFENCLVIDCPEGREFRTDSKIEMLDLSNCNLGQFNVELFSTMPQLHVLDRFCVNIGYISREILKLGLNLKEISLWYKCNQCRSKF